MTTSLSRLPSQFAHVVERETGEIRKYLFFITRSGNGFYSIDAALSKAEVISSIAEDYLTDEEEPTRYLKWNKPKFFTKIVIEDFNRSKLEVAPDHIDDVGRLFNLLLKGSQKDQIGLRDLGETLHVRIVSLH